MKKKTFNKKIAFRETRKQHGRRLELIKRYGNRCYLCGKELGMRELTIDHVKPLSKGGQDTIDNMRPCCEKCNFNKSDKEISLEMAKGRLNKKEIEAIRKYIIMKGYKLKLSVYPYIYFKDKDGKEIKEHIDRVVFYAEEE